MTSPLVPAAALCLLLVAASQPTGHRGPPEDRHRQPGGDRPGMGSPGERGPCKIVELETNVTVERVTCPTNSTCTLLDPNNPNPKVEIYFCTGSQLPPYFPNQARPRMMQPCRVIDLATNTSTEGPAVCPPTSNCSVVERPPPSGTTQTTQNVYCTRPEMPDLPRPGMGGPGGRPEGSRPGGRPEQPPHCKVVVLATNEMLFERPCPGGGNCTELDMTNTDPNLAKYKCDSLPATSP